MEQKFKHVSKSFDSKFDNYSTVLTDSQNKINEQIKIITEANERAKQESAEIRANQDSLRRSIDADAGKPAAVPENVKEDLDRLDTVCKRLEAA